MSVDDVPMITVFRSRLRDEAHSDYEGTAERMSALARTMPGYLEHKSFTADDGERVTVAMFADRASHDAWRQHPEHIVAQQSGIDRYYSEYSIQVAAIEHSRSFHRD